MSSNLTASASASRLFTSDMRLTAVVNRLILVGATAGGAISTAAMDLSELWDFSQPAASEARFVAALDAASADERLILKTQIARTYSLRGDFARARQLLNEIEPAVVAAGPEARVRHALETGRTHISATHAPQARTADARKAAQGLFQTAIDVARAAQLDGLAIDAIHMMAFVEPQPSEQLKWTLQALALAEASDQAAARDWRPSLHNNAGMALHDLGRLDEALIHFRHQTGLRAQAGDVARERVARWMEAWTLRGLGRLHEALTIQLQLEMEFDRAGQVDVYVFQELEALYKALGDEVKVTHYAALRTRAAGR